MFPKIPKTKQDEGGRRPSWNGRRAREGVEVMNLRARREARTNRTPEFLGETSRECQVICFLQRHIAQRALGVNQVNNVLLDEDVSRVDPPLNQKPTEEPHMQGVGFSHMKEAKVIESRGRQLSASLGSTALWRSVSPRGARQ